MRYRWCVVPCVAAAAVVLAACGSRSSPTDQTTSTPAASATGQANTGAGTVAVKMVSTSNGTVLANADGLTLYWFANDTSSQSNCNGACTSYWPPVLGTAVAAAGTSLPDGFGTIKRANGQTQATYDGHPLYTYAGDTAAGQVNGNGLNASGGLWWAITPSGAELTASSAPVSAAASSGSGAGGW